MTAYIKRFHDYETIGARFKEIHLGQHLFHRMRHY